MSQKDILDLGIRTGKYMMKDFKKKKVDCVSFQH